LRHGGFSNSNCSWLCCHVIDGGFFIFRNTSWWAKHSASDVWVRLKVLAGRWGECVAYVDGDGQRGLVGLGLAYAAVLPWAG